MNAAVDALAGPPSPEGSSSSTAAFETIVSEWVGAKSSQNGVKDGGDALLVDESPHTESNASWIISGGLDRRVKVISVFYLLLIIVTEYVHQVWNTPPSTRMSHQPTYTLHTAFPVRRVLWRPDFPTELAIASNSERGIGSGSSDGSSPSIPSDPTEKRLSVLGGVLARNRSRSGRRNQTRSPDLRPEGNGPPESATSTGDAIEIWDVRRGWIAKWTVGGSTAEGGVSGVYRFF
jgi:WD repeat-containing protein 24